MHVFGNASQVMLEVLANGPQVIFDGLTLGAMYAVVALGYTMVYGILELINFAHGEIFMTGAFIGTALLLTTKGMLGLDLLPGVIVLMVIILLSSALTGVLGVSVERLAYRPLRKKNSPKLIALITALAISFLLQDSIRFIAELVRGNYNITGQTLLNDKYTIPLSKVFSFFQDINIKANTIAIILAAVAIMISLDLFVNRTKWGIAMRSVAQDPQTASLMAIDVNKVIVITFLIGSSLGGATGVLYAQQYPTIDPYIGFIIGIKAFTAAVVGGAGNLRGAMFGGFLIGILEIAASSNLSTLTGGMFGSEYKDVFTFLILIIVLIFKPGGLFGQVVKEKV